LLYCIHYSIFSALEDKPRDTVVVISSPPSRNLLFDSRSQAGGIKELLLWVSSLCTILYGTSVLLGLSGPAQTLRRARSWTLEWDGGIARRSRFPPAVDDQWFHEVCRPLTSYEAGAASETKKRFRCNTGCDNYPKLRIWSSGFPHRPRYPETCRINHRAVFLLGIVTLLRDFSRQSAGYPIISHFAVTKLPLNDSHKKSGSNAFDVVRISDMGRCLSQTAALGYGGLVDPDTPD
jgi:hypothetical protein